MKYRETKQGDGQYGTMTYTCLGLYKLKYQAKKGGQGEIEEET